MFADSSVFKVFDIPFFEGDPKTALKEPHTLVISKTAADKYFPGEQALGQMMIDNAGDSWKITGVMKDIQSNTHFYFDFLLSLITVDYNRDGSWVSNNFSTYIKLHEGADAKALEAKLPKFTEMYVGPQIKATLDLTMDKFR